MKKRKLDLATQYIIILCMFLLAVNIVFGVVHIRRSSKDMNTLIRSHMLAVADTAAAAIDGDALEALTAEDVGTPVFTRIAETMTKVMNAQKDSDIKYIYAVKKEGDGYVFTVDPDPVSPGAFGEPVVPTAAQDLAWEGISSVDDKTYTDKWGSFYTAWSPVRNSAGKVIGMVGVDFVAGWYDDQVASHTMFVVCFSTLSIAVGIIIMLLMTGQLRKRIRNLNSELSVLSADVEKLSEEIRVNPNGKQDETEDEETPVGHETISMLSSRIRVMQQKLKEYIEYAQAQAYTDSMTGMGNKTAYLDYVKEISQKINEGTASFAIAVFDINSLKNTNDIYGHECGDRIIVDAAALIKRVFGDVPIFRIGGDEFIAVLGSMSETELEKLFETLDEQEEQFIRSEKEYAMTLSFARGGAVYRPGEDTDFKKVFKRADENMYSNKETYYRSNGRSRRRFDQDTLG